MFSILAILLYTIFIIQCKKLNSPYLKLSLYVTLNFHCDKIIQVCSDIIKMLPVESMGSSVPIMLYIFSIVVNDHSSMIKLCMKTGSAYACFISVMIFPDQMLPVFE